MSRLPAVEKLPLAVRKNIRDEWDSKKADYEKELTDLLGEAWTIDVNPNQLYPYGEDNGYAKTSTGAMISEYISSAIYKLKYFIEKNGDMAKAEVNSAAPAHVLTMDVDLEKQFSYNGCVITSEGQLAILFGEQYLGTNISNALDDDKLDKALNTASAEQPLSFIARRGIATEYDPEIKAVQDKINGLLQKEFTLVPNFEDTFAKLGAAKVDDREWWERNLGSFTKKYIESLADTLKDKSFGEDEMLREGFTEAVESGKIEFRIVDSTKKSYNETVIEDGVLYLQTSPTKFGSNIYSIAEDLIDLL